jgi:SAM-dependent methyltransferase
MRLSTEQAIQRLRRDPRNAALIADAYLEEDVQQAARRFSQSAEFKEVLTILGGVAELDILDLGSGRGVAAWGFATAGAQRVYALEPDASADIGRGAIDAISDGLPIQALDGVGESLPLESSSVDIVYGRQVFHHAQDLDAMARECGRVARDGALALVCREHVVDDEVQLEQFLERHPIHALTGGEGAHSLDRYLSAFEVAEFDVKRVFGPWDTVINAFPAIRANDALSRYPATLLAQRIGWAGKLAARVPGVTQLVWARLRRPVPGRLYTFLATRRPRPS